MTDYTELVKALRERARRENEWYEQGGDIINDAADAIDALQADMKTYGKTAFDEGYAMGFAAGEDRAEKQMPKRGEWLPGREISRSYIGDCCVSIDFEDWRCSICGNIIEIPCNPKYKYCPNCGAKMEVLE